MRDGTWLALLVVMALGCMAAMPRPEPARPKNPMADPDRQARRAQEREQRDARRQQERRESRARDEQEFRQLIAPLEGKLAELTDRPTPTQWEAASEELRLSHPLMDEISGIEGNTEPWAKDWVARWK